MDDEAGAGALPVEARPLTKLQRFGPAAGLVLGLGACVALVFFNGRRLAEDRFWWMGQGEFSLQHPDLAAPLLLRALHFDSREDRLWDLYAQTEVSNEMIWDSIGNLRRAHELAPYDPQISVRLGRDLVENKQYAEAETVLSGAAEHTPNFYDVWEPWRGHPLPPEQVRRSGEGL